ncbi:MAG: Gfo/Idh/MocA family oxidoreductase [Bacteroidales bacterium]
MERRNLLKAFAGIPVLGALGVEVFRKSRFDRRHSAQSQIVKALELEDLMDSVKPVRESTGDVIRLGLAGFGMRGPQLARALGFVDKESFRNSPLSAELETQLKQGNLHVALTGICDVFDLHADMGLAAARHDIHTEGEFASKHPVKRYRHYHDMLEDPDIDAVIIATPDFHHARMTREAIEAGKHVYCEKALVRREEELEPVYQTDKGSDRVFQLGHQNPQNAIFQQARELIRRGLLGKISHVETTTNRNTANGAWFRHVDNQGNLRPGDAGSIDWTQWLGDSPSVPFDIKRFYSWARYFDYDTGLFGQLFSHEYDAVNQLLHLGIPDTVVSSGGQYFYTEFGEIPDLLHSSFEYPDKGITLTYSANLTNSHSRGRTIYGQDAAMTVGNDLTVVPDSNSKRLDPLLKKGYVSAGSPMLEIRRDSQPSSALDAVSTASARYYASRGLTSTNIHGKAWDVTHLHLKEWIDCIRNGGQPSAHIDMAYEESVTLVMADIAYREQCRTKWNPVTRKIERL